MDVELLLFFLLWHKVDYNIILVLKVHRLHKITLIYYYILVNYLQYTFLILLITYLKPLLTRAYCIIKDDKNQFYRLSLNELITIINKLNKNVMIIE